MTVYASHNMFRDGWCVLARNNDRVLSLFKQQGAIHVINEYYAVFHTEPNGPHETLVPRLRLREKNTEYLALHPFSGEYKGEPKQVRFSKTSGQNEIINFIHDPLMGRDERHVREFMVSMRPFLRGLKESLVHRFINNFVYINPVNWNDAQELLFEDLTLMEVAFQRLCRNELPLSYIKQHCPTYMYTAIKFMCNFDKI